MEIGYQLFESNVRCEIKNSSVNKAIKASLLSNRGRKEFKHLNNGITIVCDSFQPVGPEEKPTGLRVLHPGVINGLQTIKTLADSVSEQLTSNDFEHFRDNCQILTRVHTQDSVHDYRALVKSTNNQNPMKPRNLRSNSAEQVILERYFAEGLGWFYERKEGAWNAFKADPSRWSTIDQKPGDFAKTRGTTKKVDNEEIAQTWLAFIGFSEQAMTQKRYLFTEDRAFYELIFMNRTRRHGRRYNHSLAGSKDDAAPESPTGEGLLVSYLVREFARNVVLTRKENRERAIERRNIANLDRAKQEAELERDTEYWKGLVLRGMLLLFVEFVGFLMFSTFGDEVHSKLGKLLKNGTLGEIADQGDVSIARRRVDGDYEAEDVLVHLWELYNHCVSQMLATAWLRERQQAPNISKFIYSERTREPLYNELEEIGKLFRGQQQLIRTWTIAINEKRGVENYLKAVLA